MYWDVEMHGHKTRLKENGSYLSLVCLTCDPKGIAPVEYDRVDYPKYRLAYYAAVQSRNAHFAKFR